MVATSHGYSQQLGVDNVDITYGGTGRTCVKEGCNPILSPRVPNASNPNSSLLRPQLLTSPSPTPHFSVSNSSLLRPQVFSPQFSVSNSLVLRPQVLTLEEEVLPVIWHEVWRRLHPRRRPPPLQPPPVRVVHRGDAAEQFTCEGAALVEPQQAPQ